MAAPDGFALPETPGWVVLATEADGTVLRLEYDGPATGLWGCHSRVHTPEELLAHGYTSVELVEVDLHEPVSHWALDCAYYRGEGACSRLGPSCWVEPSCQADEPAGGWRRRDRLGRFASQP